MDPGVRTASAARGQGRPRDSATGRQFVDGDQCVAAASIVAPVCRAPAVEFRPPPVGPFVLPEER